MSGTVPVQGVFNLAFDCYFYGHFYHKLLKNRLDMLPLHIFFAKFAI